MGYDSPMRIILDLFGIVLFFIALLGLGAGVAIVVITAKAPQAGPLGVAMSLAKVGPMLRGS
jgi:hypothetical protein